MKAYKTRSPDPDGGPKINSFLNRNVLATSLYVYIAMNSVKKYLKHKKEIPIFDARKLPVLCFYLENVHFNA